MSDKEGHKHQRLGARPLVLASDAFVSVQYHVVPVDAGAESHLLVPGYIDRRIGHQSVLRFPVQQLFPEHSPLSYIDVHFPVEDGV